MKKKSKRKTASVPEPPAYQPTGPEQITLLQHEARKGNDTAPRLRVHTIDPPLVLPDHPDIEVAYKLLMEALGTSDPYFVFGFIGELAAVSTQGSPLNESRLNQVLSMVKGIRPKDQVEAMLAGQMAAVHAAIIASTELLYKTQTPQHQDIVANALNKFARTFAMQMEALKRYRTGGQQTVTVQHVSVSEGGQAIVGNLFDGSSGTVSKQSRRSQTNLTTRQAAPIAGDAPRTSGAARRTNKNEKEAQPSP